MPLVLDKLPRWLSRGKRVWEEGERAERRNGTPQVTRQWQEDFNLLPVKHSVTFRATEYSILKRFLFLPEDLVWEGSKHRFDFLSVCVLALLNGLLVAGPIHACLYGQPIEVSIRFGF